MGRTVTVGDAVGKALRERGVAQIFGVVGSGNFVATNAMIEGGARFVAARHEMGAACMADAYTRLTGELAVVSVHQGCGLTNAMTGIAEAAKCHTPILVVTGDTALGDVSTNFAIDQDRAVEALGAVAMRIHTAETAVADAVAAFDRAMRDRVTVVLSLPIDLQSRPWEGEVALPPRGEVLPAGASTESIARLAEALARAERPVIVGGRGARHASTELRALAEQSGALLATSAAGRGLFVGDEWALDIMGGFSTPGAAELIREADLLVGFGVALNGWTTHRGTLAVQPVVIQVDDRREAFGLHRPVSLAILGDTAQVAAAVRTELASRGAARTGYRTPDVAERVQAARNWVDQPVDEPDDDGLVGAKALTNALDAMLPLERVVVPDGGNVNFFAGAFFRVPDEKGYVVPLGFQSIGLGLASAIGAGVAQPQRLPILGTGDGSFMMSLVELDTAVRLSLGMVIVVYNDDAYGAEVHLFPGQQDRHGVVRFPETDVAAIARGFGCEAITVRNLGDLGGVEDWLAGPRDRPLVIDAKIAGYPTPLMEDDDPHH